VHDGALRSTAVRQEKT